MVRVHRRTEGFAAAYLDDIIQFYKAQHLKHICWKEETSYIDYVLGRGVICPQVGKVEAIMVAECPTAKKQVHSFLGLAG